MQIQTRTAPALATISTAASTPRDAVSTKSPAETALAEIMKKNQDAASALSRLGQSSRSDKEAAADAAKKKLEALRERLKTLMMMGGDPKAVAKAAAQIAKEIGQAAKDYAKAGGGAAAAGAGAVTSADPATQPAGESSAAAETGDGAATGPDPSTILGGYAAATDGSQAGAAASHAANAVGAHTQDSGAAGLGGGQSDDPVVKAARKLAQTAKELFTSASQQAQRQHRKDDLGEDSQKIAEADSDIDNAGRALGGGGSSAYLAGGGAADDPAASTISITA